MFVFTEKFSVNKNRERRLRSILSVAETQSGEGRGRAGSGDTTHQDCVGLSMKIDVV